MKSSGELPPEAEKPHALTAGRYLPLATSSGGANGRRTLTSQASIHRLHSGTICSNCLAWPMSATGIAASAMNVNGVSAILVSSKGSIAPILFFPWRTRQTSLLSVQDTSPSATIQRAPGVDAFSSFSPFTFGITCNICFFLIPRNAACYHCFSCPSEHSGSYREPPVNGDYDICMTCYSKLEESKHISTDNGHMGWRRCLRGHRMIIFSFDDGQRRIILDDLVGGRSLQDEPSQSSGEVGLR